MLRSGQNAIGGAIMSGAKKLDNFKCSFTGNCFVGDTKVLVFESVPNSVAASFVPIPLAAGTDLVGDSSIGAWMALTMAGVVIVVAKKKQKKHLQASIVFEEESSHQEPDSIPFLTDDQVATLERTGTFTIPPSDSTPLSFCKYVPPSRPVHESALHFDEQTGGVGHHVAQTTPIPPIPSHHDWSSVDDEGAKPWTFVLRLAMVATVFAICVWLAGLWRDSESRQSQTAIPDLSAAALVNTKSDPHFSGLELASPSSDVRITTKQISDIEVGIRVPA